MSQENILEIIKSNPGILQKNIQKMFENRGEASRRVRTLLAAREIKREWSKEFQSFKLFANP